MILENYVKICILSINIIKMKASKFDRSMNIKAYSNGNIVYHFIHELHKRILETENACLKRDS